MIFNESKPEASDEEAEGDLMHSINGYIFGNLTGLVMEKGDRVRWHLLGLGTEVDVHTVQWHGETVLSSGKRTDIIELLPASMVSIDMDAEEAAACEREVREARASSGEHRLQRRRVQRPQPPLLQPRRGDNVDPRPRPHETTAVVANRSRPWSRHTGDPQRVLSRRHATMKTL